MVNEENKNLEIKQKLPGRPVRMVSIGFAMDKPLEQVAALVDAEGAKGADLIALPETATGQSKETAETLEGKTIRTLSALARKHKTYIVCGLDRLDGDRRVNSAVLIDRQGKVACVYDKMYPFWAEFELSPPVSAGKQVVVYDTDFGRLGLAICFDVNFPSVWQQLADKDAELVVWISAYSSGTSLQAYAINHHYTIVSATQSRDCQVYDITGERILDESSDDIHISRTTIDLDRCIFHKNIDANPVAKINKLFEEHADDIVMEKDLPREEWFVLKAKKPGVSARKLAKQYGLRELRDYMDYSRDEIDKMRKDEK